MDVTERREPLAAKTAMLHEVEHRVKNNLQMVAALIAMQAGTIGDGQVQRSLDVMLRRIEALSTVHRRLYQSDDVTRISVAEFVHDIVTELVGVTGREDIAVHLDLDPVSVPAEDAAPLALVVNELVTNALKHALPATWPGRISAVSKRDGASLRIEIEDDGIGMPARAPSASSLGLELVRMMTRQLRAVSTWSSVEPSGTRVVVEMPVGRRSSDL